jgi:hypothetical protein
MVYDYSAHLLGSTSAAAIAETLDELLAPDAERDWRARTGRFATYGLGEGAWNTIAGLIGRRLYPGLRPNGAAVTRLAERDVDSRTLRSLVTAAGLYTPIALRAFTRTNISEAAPGASGGVYVLLELDTDGRPSKLYAGKSDSGLATRLRGHLSNSRHSWSMFAAEASSRQATIEALEGALFHIVPTAITCVNRSHPPNCPHCSRRRSRS